MCWIFWVFDLDRSSKRDLREDALRLLRWNKNRWQEWYWLSVLTEGKITTYKFKENKNVDIFDEISKVLNDIKEDIFWIIGHAWYPTSGSKWWDDYKSIQPYWLDSTEAVNETESLIKVRELVSGHSFAFNGNIANASDIAVEKYPQEFPPEVVDTLLDTRVLQTMILDSAWKWYDTSQISIDVHNQIDGSCNMILMEKNGSFTLSKDRWWFRPLSYAEHIVEWENWERLFYFSSESSALFDLGFDYGEHIKRVNTWEEVKFTPESWNLIQRLMDLNVPIVKSRCFFETVYFSDRRSELFGMASSSHRFRLWQQMAERDHNRFLNHKNAVVLPIPASSQDAAEWYSTALNLPLFDTAITKNPEFDKRSFLWATKEERLKILEQKYIFNPALKPLLKWKEIIIVDDSVVRGTTLEFLIQMIQEFYEPSAIHIRIPSPPIMWPCYYAINLKHPKELIVRSFFENPQEPTYTELYELADHFWVESISYLGIDKLIEALKVDIRDMCLWCVTWDYPTPKWREIFAKQLIEEAELNKTPA